jgi:single-stranded DNA-specific DHH superfamily exonuclease
MSVLIGKSLSEKIIKKNKLPQDYFFPGESRAPRPLQIPSVEKIGRELLDMPRNSRIYISVDSDIDGMTAFTLLFKYLRFMGYRNVQPLITLGKNHGIKYYLDEIKELIRTQKIDGLFILDSSSDEESVDYVKSLSKYIRKIFILDHHKPFLKSENGYQREGFNNVFFSNSMYYPDGEDYCASMVVFILCTFWDRHLNVRYSKELYEYLALAILGDVMSLRNMTNRYILFHVLNKGVRDPLLKLMVEDKQDFFNAEFMAFYMVPLINAAIRLEDRKAITATMRHFAVPYVIEDKAPMCFRRLKDNNEKRKALQKEYADTFEDTVYDINLYIRSDFPAGLRGLVANELVSRYKKPAIIVNPMGWGSCRSTHKINLQETLLKAGYKADGHAKACGVFLGEGFDPGTVVDNLIKNIERYVEPPEEKMIIDLADSDLIGLKREEIKRITLIEGPQSKFVWRIKNPKIENVVELKKNMRKIVGNYGLNILDFIGKDPEGYQNGLEFKFMFNWYKGEEQMSGKLV